MSKKTVFFTFCFVLFFSLAVSAATGGNSTDGHMMMVNHNGMMTKHTKHMATHNSNTTQTMTLKTAKTEMKMYMDTNSQGGYELKNFTDDGSYFRADVLSPEGTLQNEIVVNKKTGVVYFSKKK